ELTEETCMAATVVGEGRRLREDFEVKATHHSNMSLSSVAGHWLGSEAMGL
ncbi:unnamed protein product, partial [Durusdinium trenchii]